ncbi:MAG: LysR family transcriptional regulator, partial [Hyphomicrobiales bacterium]|nr:LysR family transcriptional regulator [Hyphomicrobiales bacterium]
MTPRFDLNLLLLFDAIMAERNLTRAGQRLGLSQPAVSAAVARLRDLLCDPLFVRTSHGVTPTAKANRIAKPLSEALRAILELTSDELNFDPATSSRIFTIMMPDVGELNILPRLLSRIQRLPSDISISVAPISSTDEGHALEAGKVDLAIGNWPGLSTERGFQSRLLFQDSFVCLVRSGNPLVGEEATLSDLLAAAHIVVGRGHEAQSPISRLAGLASAKWKIAARIPHYLGVPGLLNDTDLVAIMPARPAA